MLFLVVLFSFPGISLYHKRINNIGLDLQIAVFLPFVFLWEKIRRIEAIFLRSAVMFCCKNLTFQKWNISLLLLKITFPLEYKWELTVMFVVNPWRAAESQQGSYQAPTGSITQSYPQLHHVTEERPCTFTPKVLPSVHVGSKQGGGIHQVIHQGRRGGVYGRRQWSWRTEREGDEGVKRLKEMKRTI